MAPSRNQPTSHTPQSPAPSAERRALYPENETYILPSNSCCALSPETPPLHSFLFSFLCCFYPPSLCCRFAALTNSKSRNPQSPERAPTSPKPDHANVTTRWTHSSTPNRRVLSVILPFFSPHLTRLTNSPRTYNTQPSTMSEGEIKPTPHAVVQEAHEVDTYHVPKAFFE